MRYIKKHLVPNSFIEKTKNLEDWEEYHECCFSQKQALKRYILSCEQNYLCIYCESKIKSTKEDSHFEHIRPKAKNMYPELTFDYNNLAISCNGTCFNLMPDDIKYNCGHIKENEYDEDNFLHPFEVIEIESYFEYDFDDFKISPTDKNFEKAKYMIDILKLNSGRLLKARENTYNSYRKKMKRIKDITKRNEKIKKNINSVEIQFISFFKNKYKYLFG